MNSRLGVGTGMRGARYTAERVLDNSFNQQGSVTFDRNFGHLAAVAVDADGRILAAGAAGNGSRFNTMSVVRLRPDGSFDPTFGSGGKASVAVGTFYSAANALALLPDGGIVVAGEAYGGPSRTTHLQFAAAVFAPDGTNDTTFGVPHDINHDGIVDFPDLLILATHFGKRGTFADGDLNGDGVINMDDLLIVIRSYGSTAAIPARHRR